MNFASKQGLSLFFHHVCKFWTKLLREIKDHYFACGDILLCSAMNNRTATSHWRWFITSFLFTTAWHKWQVIRAALKESNIPFHAFFFTKLSLFLYHSHLTLAHISQGTSSSGYGVVDLDDFTASRDTVAFMFSFLFFSFFFSFSFSRV